MGIKKQPGRHALSGVFPSQQTEALQRTKRQVLQDTDQESYPYRLTDLVFATAERLVLAEKRALSVQVAVCSALSVRGHCAVATCL